jgi:hypothetical protein
MIPVVFALLLAQDKAVVEGIVINALTNEPLRKAHVALDGGKNRYAVVSGNEGKFRFEGIEPGEYEPHAQRQGFLDADDEEDFGVAKGEHVKDIVIKLTPQGVISGHVVDEDGDPVPGLLVRAARTIHIDGRAVELGSEQAFTDNEGYFLVSELRAGRYYLSVEPSRHGRMPARRGHPGIEQEFVHTDDPVPRDITAGAALRNVEIHIRKSAVFRIRGRVSNPPNDRIGIYLLPPDRSRHPNEPQASLHDGAFEFEGIAPGSYVLSFTTGALFSHIPVTVADRDLDGIVAELTPGPSVQGTIKMDGGGRFPKPPTLQLAGFSMNMVTAKEDGTFGWTNLMPTKYVIDYGPPDGCYVKSIQFNQQPVTLPILDLTSGAGGRLDIVVAQNAATVAASVEGGKKAQVTLWSESRSFYTDTDANGAIVFDHLAPGEYRILAWQKVEEQFVEMPEFRARFEAQRITLAEGAHENIEVKLISKSASDAEVAKLQ